LQKRSIEWPTLFVALGIHAAWLGLTSVAVRLPLWVLVPLGGFVVAWHGSLQHETIHGHPTRSRAFNTLIASLPLSLWIPYGIYRSLHLAHHKTSALTDPLEDPESFYVTKERWDRASAPYRALLWINTTLAGRLLLGPAIVIVRFIAGEALALAKADLRHARAWCKHLVGVALVLAWLHVCHLSVGVYFFAFVYPGVALTLMRSFAEHKPARDNGERVAIVEAGPALSLLYLNNNLHVVHHEEPALPWYELPARYREHRSEVLAKNGHYHFSGYGALLARFGIRPKDAPVHPEL
jgi:fatty acid desaturase